MAPSDLANTIMTTQLANPNHAPKPNVPSRSKYGRCSITRSINTVAASTMNNTIQSRLIVLARVSQWSSMTSPSNHQFCQRIGNIGCEEHQHRSDRRRGERYHDRPRRLAGLVSVPIARGLAEECTEYDRHEIGSIEHRAGDNDRERQPIGGLHRPGEYEPLAEKAGGRRNADHAERADCEGAHGPRHAAADAVELAYLSQMRGGIDRPGREEQRYLADGVRGEMHRGADHRDRRQDGDAA